jgi:hypothetical protein
MAHKLARLTTGHGKTQTEDHIVQAALKQREEVLTGHTFLAGSLLEVVSKLRLEQIVDAFDTLFLAELLPVADRLTLRIWTVLTRGVDAAFLDRTGGLEALLTFEKQLLALTPTQATLFASISSQSLSSVGR